MPIYEYSCIICGNKFEKIMHVGDKNPECEKCKGETKRLISRFLGVIKGSEHRLLDCVVGEDADKRRSILEKRKEKRNNNNKQKEVKNVLV